MLAIIALIMIAVFMYIMLRNKLPIFSALILISLIFGVIVVLLTGATFTDLFQWMYDGMFFKQDPVTGEVEAGVVPASMLIMFAVLYFDVMLDAGMFDGAITFFIRIAKGDPLRILLATYLTSCVVSLSGDTTTTIIVCLSTFLTLYKELNINLGYLALAIVGPSIVFNLLPWGGPTVSASIVTGVGLTELFGKMIPAMVVGLIYTFFIIVYLGRKERQRLADELDKDEEISEGQMERMIASVHERGKEYKHYENTGFNVILTIILLALLFTNVAHGSVLFMIGTAVAVTYNYRTPGKSTEIIERNAADAILPAIGSLAAGVFSGVLTNSGMAAALAEAITRILPASLGQWWIVIYAVMSALFLIILPTDAYFFGITRVLTKTFEGLGITPMQTAVASLIGESWAIMSPTIASIHVLCDRCQISIGDYQKLYLRYYGPLLVIWLVTLGFSGAI